MRIVALVIYLNQCNKNEGWCKGVTQATNLMHSFWKLQRQFWWLGLNQGYSCWGFFKHIINSVYSLTEYNYFYKCSYGNTKVLKSDFQMKLQ